MKIYISLSGQLLVPSVKTIIRSNPDLRFWAKTVELGSDNTLMVKTSTVDVDKESILTDLMASKIEDFAVVETDWLGRDKPILVLTIEPN